jgi:hypothetical protein
MHAMQQPRHHGIEQPAQDCFGRFHFAVWRFTACLQHWYYLPPLTAKGDVPSWPTIWKSNKFDEACVCLKQTLDKLNRVAWLLETARRTITEKPLESMGMPHRDLAIHLDSILSYLLVFADTVAQLTPYLYGQEGRKANITPGGFRRQRDKWFLTDKNDLDVEYAEILRQHTHWLDTLVGQGGDDEGLRNHVIHHLARFDIVPMSEDGGDSSVLAGMFGKISGDVYGYIHDDVFPVLTEVVAGLCVFLDKYVEHFNVRVGNQVGRNTIIDLTDPHQTEGCRYDGELGSLWLYPKVERAIQP